MCGLLGFSGHKGHKFDKNKIKTLFLYNQDRGKDASGFWSPNNNLVKSLDQATKFLTKDFKQIQEDHMLIGHVRQGTIGKNMLNVAHPFEGDNAVLAHNGTLTNYTNLAYKYNIKASEYTTDTQVLHKILDSNFSTKILSEIDGSASLLIGDKNIKLKKGQQNSFLMTFRLNSQRPLFYGMSEEGMYISSLEDSLESIDCTDIKEFNTNTLYTIFEGKIIKELIIPCRPCRTYQNTNTHSSHNSSSHHNSNTNAITGAHLDYWNKYINNWIKADRYIPAKNESQFDLTTNTYYLLKEVNKESNTIVIENDEGKSMSTLPFNFYYNQPNRPINGLTDNFVVVMKKLTDTTNPKSIVFNRGDVVSIKPLERINSKGEKILNCLSHIDGEYYDVQSTFLRPVESTELVKYNIYDSELNTKISNNLNNSNSNSNPNSSSFTQESFIGQYIVDNGLLTSDELTLLLKVCDNKEMSSLFDIAEDMVISINDLTDLLIEEHDGMSLVGVKAINNTLDELKEKTSSLLINAVDSWKKQMIA
jgi:hypothetical protein